MFKNNFDFMVLWNDLDTITIINITFFQRSFANEFG